MKQDIYRAGVCLWMWGAHMDVGCQHGCGVPTPLDVGCPVAWLVFILGTVTWLHVVMGAVVYSLF